MGNEITDETMETREAWVKKGGDDKTFNPQILQSMSPMDLCEMKTYRVTQ